MPKGPLGNCVSHVAVVIRGQDASNAARTLGRVKERYPDVTPFWSDVKFTDSRGRKGQKNTPVADVRGIVEIIVLLPGTQAARLRRQMAELVVRYLGGDLTIIDVGLPVLARPTLPGTRGSCTPRR